MKVKIKLFIFLESLQLNPVVYNNNLDTVNIYMNTSSKFKIAVNKIY